MMTYKPANIEIDFETTEKSSRSGIKRIVVSKSFEQKRWGMHFDNSFKIKVRCKRSGEKICSFLTTFYFIDPEAGCISCDCWFMVHLPKKKDHKKDSVLFTVIINNYLWIP